MSARQQQQQPPGTRGNDGSTTSATSSSRSGSLVASMFNMVKRRATRGGASRDENAASSLDRSRSSGRRHGGGDDDDDDRMAGFAADASEAEIFCENPDDDVQAVLESLEDDALEFGLPAGSDSGEQNLAASRKSASKRQSMRLSRRVSMRSAGASSSSSGEHAGSRVSVKRVEDFPGASAAGEVQRGSSRLSKRASTASPPAGQNASVLRRLSTSLTRRSSSRSGESLRRASSASRGLEEKSARDLVDGLDLHKGKRISAQKWSQARKSRRGTRTDGGALVARSETAADVVIRTDDDLETLCEAMEAGEARAVRFANGSGETLAEFAAVLGAANGEGPVALDISGARGARGLEAVVEILADGACEALEVLDMSRTPLAPVFTQFASSLESVPVLRELTLRMCSLSPAQVRTLSEALVSMPQLELLDLSGNELTLSSSGDNGAIGALVENMVSVQTLGLRACGADDETVAVLCASLAANDTVVSLDLSGNPFTGQACEELVSVLGSTRSALAHLDLSYTGVDAGGMASLSAALQDPDCGLASLDLRSCPLGVEGCFALAEALEGNPGLSKLTVGGPLLPPHTTHGVCSEGVARLLEMLRSNEGLTEVVIAEGTVSSDVQYVVDQLASTLIEDRTARLAEMLVVDAQDSGALNVLSEASRASLRRSARRSGSCSSSSMADGADAEIDSLALTDMAFAMSVGETAVHAACMAWLASAGYNVSKFPSLGGRERMET